MRFRLRGLSRASLRIGEAWSREREGEQFRRDASLSFSTPGLESGDSTCRPKSSCILRVKLRGEEEEDEEEEGRGRLFVGCVAAFCNTLAH